ncbi:MAG TPA: AmmeMemoRadiSam system radical SAM enzyme [Synergistaceae bacterium]|nr:AmmeMemoRadiSam system radical SAM enzyme [Synergistaceae bacterium]
MKNDKEPEEKSFSETLPFRNASWWHWEGENVRCELCFRSCLLAPGDVGFCNARRHVPFKGLSSLVYGRPLAWAVDPVEKKPLYHYFPGEFVLSLGTRGCTMDCPYCQNHQLVHAEISTREHSPEEIVAAGIEQNLSLLAFTYNEPTVWYEFLRDCASLWKEKGNHAILVTNGQMLEKPLRELAPLLGACNVDIKSFNKDQYQKLLKGSLADAQRFVEILVEQNVHVEVTWLVVPGMNTENSFFRSCTRWLASLSPFIPLHITRAFPAYRWKGPPPSLELLRNLRQEAREDLQYVYLGNTGVPENTQCHNCGNDIVIRSCYNALDIEVGKEGKCPFCGAPTHIITGNSCHNKQEGDEM